MIIMTPLNVSTFDNITVSGLTYLSYLASGIYVAVVGLMATFGNLLVIVVIVGHRKKINMTKKQHVPLLLNLALADIGVSIFGYPYTSLSGIAGRWMFTDAVCSMAGFFCFLLSLVSLDTMVAIGIFRYIVICKPNIKPRLSMRAVGYVVVLTWIYAFGWAVIPLFGPARYTYETFGTSCSIDWKSRRRQDIIYIILVDIFCFLTHLSVIAFCYIQIILRYRYLSAPCVAGAAVNGGLQKLKTRRDMRVTWLVLVQVGTFVIIWSPYAIVSTWNMVYDLPLWSTMIPTMFAKLSCAMNPILYGLLNRTFRRMSRNILCKCSLRKVGKSAEKYSADICLKGRPKAYEIFCVTGNMERLHESFSSRHEDSGTQRSFSGSVSSARESIRNFITGAWQQHGSGGSFFSSQSLSNTVMCQVDNSDAPSHRRDSSGPDFVTSQTRRASSEMTYMEPMAKLDGNAKRLSASAIVSIETMGQNRLPRCSRSDSTLQESESSCIKEDILRRSNNMCLDVWRSGRVSWSQGDKVTGRRYSD